MFCRHSHENSSSEERPIVDPVLAKPMTQALLGAAPNLTKVELNNFIEAFTIYMSLIAPWSVDKSAKITSYLAKTGTEAYFNKTLPFCPGARENIKKLILSQFPDETECRIKRIIRATEGITKNCIKYLGAAQMAFMVPPGVKVLNEYKTRLDVTSTTTTTTKKPKSSRRMFFKDFFWFVSQPSEIYQNFFMINVPNKKMN